MLSGRTATRSWVAIRVRLERRGGQLLVEELVGIVLAAVKLGDDDAFAPTRSRRGDTGSAPCARTR